jgi:hypothetical protein
MKNFKARILALCGLMVLIAAALAPIVAEAEYGSCPPVSVGCPGAPRTCYGTLVGTNCQYDQNCLNCR